MLKESKLHTITISDSLFKDKVEDYELLSFEDVLGYLTMSEPLSSSMYGYISKCEIPSAYKGNKEYEEKFKLLESYGFKEGNLITKRKYLYGPDRIDMFYTVNPDSMDDYTYFYVNEKFKELVRMFDISFYKCIQYKEVKKGQLWSSYDTDILTQKPVVYKIDKVSKPEVEKRKVYAYNLDTGVRYVLIYATFFRNYL